MLLAVDVGNTNVTFGIFSDEELLHTFRMGSLHDRTEDECAALVSQMLKIRGVGADDITSSIIASVVPPLTDTIDAAVRATSRSEPMIVGGPGMKTGVSVLYDNPRDVGADRVVNAVAAFDRVRGAVIIVDFGTATTFDCVSAHAEYQGGVIVPGIAVSLNALLGTAAKLRPVEIAAPPSVIGKSTPHAIQSGIVFGYASLVDGVLQKLFAELGGSCPVIATGGLAPLIAKHTTLLKEVDVDLTLNGLRLIFEKNSA